MKKESKFTFKGRLKSFMFAFTGLKIAFLEEYNFRIHAVAATIVVILGLLLKLNLNEWKAIVFAIGFVFVTEIINTSIERLADLLSPGVNEKIKKIKDLSAAAVLVSAITSVIIGILIFLPKLLVLIKFNP